MFRPICLFRMFLKYTFGQFHEIAANRGFPPDWGRVKLSGCDVITTTHLSPHATTDLPCGFSPRVPSDAHHLRPPSPGMLLLNTSKQASPKRDDFVKNYGLSVFLHMVSSFF